MGYPLSAGMGRTVPPSRHPHIRVAVPTVVACDPDIAGTGSGAPSLHHGPRRSDLYDYIGSQGADRKKTSESKSNQHFFQHAYTQSIGYATVRHCTAPRRSAIASVSDPMDGYVVLSRLYPGAASQMQAENFISRFSRLVRTNPGSSMWRREDSLQHPTQSGTRDNGVG
jgi:hypothetical protein